MNTPANHDDEEQRCAEYALGVLDAAERHDMEQAMQRDPRLRDQVASWQQRLMPLAEDIATLTPHARVWTRIQAELGWLPSRAGGSARGWWDSLQLWRWVAIGASVAAVALVAVNLVSLREPQVGTAQANYLVATIARSDGVAHWTATVDLRRAQMVVVPADRRAVVADRSTELWLIPPNAKPIPLGIFPPDRPATMTLAPEILAQMKTQAVLAVSLEPLGGSPTGQPTGPVLATGSVHST
jgi:anti-sigma-K factor RskA